MFWTLQSSPVTEQPHWGVHTSPHHTGVCIGRKIIINLKEWRLWPLSFGKKEQLLICFTIPFIYYIGEHRAKALLRGQLVEFGVREILPPGVEAILVGGSQDHKHHGAWLPWFWRRPAGSASIPSLERPSCIIGFTTKDNFCTSGFHYTLFRPLI